MPLQVLAQDAEKEEASESELLEEVIVTGTRRQDRTIADSPVPIDVVSLEQLTQHGSVETGKLLAAIVPSFNFTEPGLTDYTDVMRPATLRGLGPDHTLVLINGKRRHSSAILHINGSVGRGSTGVDLNTIPAAAIKRIEVLRDGAAAQYGSDAIAGVINIILNDQSDGASVTTSYGEFYTKPTGLREVTGVKTDASGQPVVGPDGNFVLADTGKDALKQDGETVTVSANMGLAIGDNGGFLNVTLEYRDRQRTNRAGWDPRQQYPLLPNGQFDPRELNFDRLAFFFGNSDVRDVTGFLNMAVPLTDTLELYSIASIQDKKSLGASFLRRSLQSQNIPEVYPDGFVPRPESETKDFSIGGGLRGDISGWNWDLSYVSGGNESFYTNLNTLNTSLGKDSPTELYGGGLDYEQSVINLDFRRLFDVSWAASPLSFAIGVEGRDENYEIVPGEPGSYITALLRDASGDLVLDDDGNAIAAGPGGAQGGLFFSDVSQVDESRDSFGFYTELDADITDAWSATIAGRYEDYSDFGSEVIGKLASRFQITDQLAIRGAVSSGFRAPSLAQQFFTSVVTNFIDGLAVDIGTFPPTSDIAQLLGATPLEPETSLNISAGLTWNPIDNLNITLDFYQIDIDDRIVFSENLPSSLVLPILEANGIFNVGGARFFINGIDTETRGFDITGTYALDIGSAGLLRFNFGFNKTDTEVTDTVVQVGPLSVLEPEQLFARRERLRFENSAPDYRLNISANWDFENMSWLMRMNSYGDTLVPSNNPVFDEEVSGEQIYDTQLSYDFDDGSKIVTLGINNVFDTYPNKRPTGQLSDGSGYFSAFNSIIPYSGFSPFGFSGRFIYGRFTIHF